MLSAAFSSAISAAFGTVWYVFRGSSPLRANDRILPRGIFPSLCAISFDITTTAAAPSFSEEEFPAVQTPPRTGFSFSSFSMLVSFLGPSSWVNTSSVSFPEGSGTGIISSLNFPFLIAAHAFWWLSKAH